VRAALSRTLLISDLHLGAYAEQCVLSSPRPLARLLAALGDVDRLVLLGDVLELGEDRPFAEVIALAAPVLAGLARNVGEIVLLPGNHDRRLIRPWLEAQGERLELEAVVPTDASPWLAETVARLGEGGAEVSVRYPGYRLSDTVWVTHGHYLDRLLVPQGPYGALRRGPAPHRPHSYERRPRPSRRPRVAAVAHQHLDPRFARITAAALDFQMRHRGLPALAAALGALGVVSEHVIFGHVHRLGPLPDDRPGPWQHALSPGAAPTRFLNTGSWQYEPLLTGHRRPPHPYAPGGSVLVAEDGIPRAVGLLDGVEARPAPVPPPPTR
jgi:hypothetical protein